MQSVTLTDWLLLGWTVTALTFIGANLYANAVVNHDAACSLAAMYDRSAARTTDAREAEHDKTMAEAYRQKAIWPCAK